MRYDSPLPTSSIARGIGVPIARRSFVTGAAVAAFGMCEREVLSAAADEATPAGALYKPGVYLGRARGFNHMSWIEVLVTFEEDRIADMRLLEDGLVDFNVTDIPVLAKGAFATISRAVIENQSLSVDCVSGATGSSSGVIAAIADACHQALVNPDDDAVLYGAVDPKSDVVVLDGYDVVVVGMGGAGMSAALSAMNAGVKVIVVERCAVPGGTTMITSGPTAWSPDISETGIEAEVARWASDEGNYASRMGGDVVWADPDYQAEHADEYRDINTAAWANVIRNAGGAIQNLITYGFRFNKGYGTEPFNDVSKLDAEGSGGTMVGWDNTLAKNDTPPWRANNKCVTARFFENAKQYLEENGVETLVNVTVNELVYSDEAKTQVVGVRGVAYDGTTYEIHATAVVLATGGYLGNRDLTIQLTGDAWGFVGLNNQGEGTLMALDAGGAPYNLGAYPMTHFGSPLHFMRSLEDEEYEGVVWSPNDVPNVMSQNPDACYIDDEGAYIDTATYAFPGSHVSFLGAGYYAIYSATQIERYKTNGFDSTNTAQYYCQHGVPVGMPVANLDSILAACYDEGLAVRSDSLAELDGMLGVSEGSCASAVAQRASEDIGDTDAYYVAVPGTILADGSLGGIEVNEHMQVVRTDGSTIENLFLPGTDSIGNLIATGCEYNGHGYASIWAVSGGYIAGMRAAELAGPSMG